MHRVAGAATSAIRYRPATARAFLTNRRSLRSCNSAERTTFTRFEVGDATIAEWNGAVSPIKEKGAPGDRLGAGVPRRQGLEGECYRRCLIQAQFAQEVATDRRTLRSRSGRMRATLHVSSGWTAAKQDARASRGEARGRNVARSARPTKKCRSSI